MPDNYNKKKLVFIPVMVALLCLGSWSQTAWAAPCIVTNTNDSGAGSLRDCLTTASGAAGTTINFNIPAGDPGKITFGSDSRWRIQPASELPTISQNNTIIDGTTQAAFIGGDPNSLGPEIEIFGNGASFNGLNITSASNTVKGLIIGGFSGGNGAGITISGGTGTGNTIAGNYLGTDYKGTAAQANFYGVYLYSGAASNTIGGTNTGARNVISGNSYYGINIYGAGTDNNLVQGNYIGVDATGTTILSNTRGVAIWNGAKSTTIGGAIANAGNVISGHTLHGISIYGTGTDNHIIQGNYIGTNAAGTAAIPNTYYGIVLSGSAKSTTIGGTIANARNVISGNQYGIYIDEAGTDNHIIQGNYIGTNAAGTAALDNNQGISIRNGAKSTTIGGAVANARNVISGNVNSGIYISDSGTDSHLIQGNYIGIDPAGTAKIANIVGVTIENGAKSTTIGGADILARNVISGNTAWGVFIGGAGTDSHLIQGNYIGTNATGTAALANLAGIFIWNGAKSTIIGGTDPLARNVISGNSNYGILIKDLGTDGHLVQGNYIGIDAAGTAPMGNTLSGIIIENGARSNTIGGTAAGAANRIAYNGVGTSISGVDSDGNIFSANSIFMNTGLGISLAGDGSNNNKAAPTITTITPSGSDFIVTATVPAASDTIQFFRANNISSPVVTPDSPAGEGYLFLGSCVDNGGACVGPYVNGSDTNGAAGIMSVTLTGGGLTVGDTLSATATDAANGTSQFSLNKVVSLKLIKQTYDISGACIASSDAADADCGSTSTVTVPAGMVVQFMIIVKNTSAQTVADVRFEDTLDESAGGFSYMTGSMTSTPVGASAPVDTASNAVLYSAATNTLTDSTGDDIGSARDLGGPSGVDNISIGLPINAVLSINAHKSFAVIFQVRKK